MYCYHVRLLEVIGAGNFNPSSAEPGYTLPLQTV